MKNEIATDLKSFVEGRLSLSDLETALEGRVRFRYADRDERLVEGSISSLPLTAFSAADVERALRRFLRDDLSRRDLSDWAATLRLLDIFEVTRSDAAIADTVWDVIDQLMSPDAWGELTTESAIELISRLE